MADHESISKTEDVQRPTPGVDLEANRVSSDYLSCEIPEGWEATYHGEGFSPLFRMSPKESGPRDDVWIDCEMGFDKDLHLENGWDTPESRLATTKSMYFSPHSIGCYFLTPLDYHTVEAHGCKCAIIQVATSNNVGLAFNIYPDGPRQPILHATFGSWNNDRLDEARELVDRLAKSICVYESDTPSYVRALQECLDSQVDPDYLFKVIANYGCVLENINKETPDMARFVKQAYKADQRTEHERLIAAVEEYAESNKSIEPYLELLADVADAQARYLKEDRANLDKLRQIVAETSKSSIFFPNSLPRDFRKLPQQEWEEVERVLAPSERMRTILSRIGIEWPNSDNVDDGNSDNDAVVPDLPTVMLTLLSDDYVFFQNNEISWSKGHHVIKGLQVNSPKQRDLATIAAENGFDDINDLLNYFIVFMRGVEKDEALVVPRASISKALHPIVRRGDLTGITLANLAASMAAFRVLNDRPNNYTVVYDGTLADGIPHFFDLMCRLLWDLRLCMTSLKGVPFRVTFVRCRNLDLSQLLKGHVSRVNGAQDDPVSVTVSEEPAIGLEAVASKEPSVKLEAAKTEEAPADEEGPSVELQTPDVPTLVMSLLSDGYVSFEDSDIPRKKGHHAIAGVGVSEQKREDLALIARQNGFDNANELIDYFVSALQEVEKDEAFFVPKKTGINKGLYRIVRKGDLTGITFANMANYTDSFRIKSEGPDAYQVEYSEPVAIGLPRFFGMVCRLIWDLRQCENAQRGIPFSVRFSRIGIEFNCIGRMSVWWEYPKVTFVDGAQDDPALVNVTSAPSTDLTEGIEIVGEQPAGAATEADSMDIPATMLALLSNGYVSFGEKDLSWSKGNHVIRGLQIGSPVHPRLATLARVNGFKNTDGLLEHFMAFMREVDKDEELIVPKASIAKALGPVVRRGDLTGITLVNLTASEAFRVINDSPNSYTVMYDDALADGIPHFFDLMCRLLWDLRQCVETLKDAPFQVTFTSCRNLDLSQLLRGSVSRVDGAQDNPGTVSVSEAPKIGHGSASASEGKAKSAGKGATRKSKPKPAAAPKSVPAAVTKPEPKPKPESKPKPKPKPATKPEPAESHNVNPMLLLTLLADDYVFFRDTDIAWERGHHVIRGMQANLPKIEELNAIARENGFDSFAELGDRLVSFLLEVEKDKALVAPRDRVSKALYPIMFDGDLTGITFANLAAYMAAFRVLDAGPNAYTVMYDPSLADGIPCFFDLMCRLLWDLRQCAEPMNVPFQVTFMGCRNLGLPRLLDGNVTRVAGAQDSPGSASVAAAPAIDLGQTAAPSPATVKKAPTISEKRAGLEKVLDRLLTAATKYREASGALWQYEEDERTLEEMPAEKKRLEKKIRSIQRKQQSISDELTANASRKHDLQEERKQLLSRADMLEEKAHELEEERGGLGFFSILRKSQIGSALKTIASRQDEIRACTEQIDEELKSLARTRKKLLKDIKEPEGKIAREQAKLEELLQEEKETKDRLENAEKSRGTLSTERSTAKGQRTKALKRYNDLISGQLFTSAEKKSDEYREMKELMTSALTKLKEQGITPINKATFPTLKA